MASMVDDILSQLPASELAAELGTDEATALEAARSALPALLGGLHAETRAGKGDALAQAVMRDHDGSLLDHASPLEAVDPADGEKILNHLFGDQLGTVEQRLGGSSGSPSIFSKLLPLLAPLVMAWLGKRLGGATAEQSGDGGLGGLLGGLFGGGDGGTGGGLGDVLGGVLGGEVDNTSMPDLGGLFDMLGGSKATPDSTDTSGLPDVGDIFGKG